MTVLTTTARSDRLGPAPNSRPALSPCGSSVGSPATTRTGSSLVKNATPAYPFLFGSTPQYRCWIAAQWKASARVRNGLQDPPPARPLTGYFASIAGTEHSTDFVSQMKRMSASSASTYLSSPYSDPAHVSPPLTPTPDPTPSRSRSRSRDTYLLQARLHPRHIPHRNPHPSFNHRLETQLLRERFVVRYSRVEWGDRALGLLRLGSSLGLLGRGRTGRAGTRVRGGTVGFSVGFGFGVALLGGHGGGGKGTCG